MKRFKTFEFHVVGSYILCRAPLKVWHIQVFGMVSGSELFTKFDVTDDAAVILLKKFDEGRNTLEGSVINRPRCARLTAYYPGKFAHLIILDRYLETHV
jgi:hypothetical protein